MSTITNDQLCDALRNINSKDVEGAIFEACSPLHQLSHPVEKIKPFRVCELRYSKNKLPIVKTRNELVEFYSFYNGDRYEYYLDEKEALGEYKRLCSQLKNDANSGDWYSLDDNRKYFSKDYYKKLQKVEKKGFQKYHEEILVYEIHQPSKNEYNIEKIIDPFVVEERVQEIRRSLERREDRDIQYFGLYSIDHLDLDSNKYLRELFEHFPPSELRSIENKFLPQKLVFSSVMHHNTMIREGRFVDCEKGYFSFDYSEFPNIRLYITEKIYREFVEKTDNISINVVESHLSTIDYEKIENYWKETSRKIEEKIIYETLKEHEDKTGCTLDHKI